MEYANFICGIESMDLQLFVNKQIKLLEVERLEEVEANRILTECSCLKYLQQKGVCIPKLHLSSSRTGLYGRIIKSFEPYLSNKNLPSHCIGSGDIVGIAHAKTDGKHDVITSGVATEIKAESISVALEKDAPQAVLESGISYFLIKLGNDASYKYMKRALKELVQENNKRCSKLISVLFGHSPPSSCDSALFHNMEFFNQNLNDRQKEAVKFAFSQKEVALLHGPPGTGKTTTVVEMILQAVIQGLKVLVCAQSNVAVDNLVEKLSLYKMKMIRLGHPARFLPNVHSYSLDAVISKCDSSKVTDDLREEIDVIKAKLEKCKERYSQKRLHAERISLLKDLKKREKAITGEILKNSSIVLSTLSSAHPTGPIKHLPKDHFNLVVIDECSQALEASCWIALLQAPKCILAGDHLQLPPTIKSEKAAKDGLSVTLMERLMKLHGKEIVKMLNIQYRMHQNIMEWPSQQLYENQLVADSSVSSHLLKDLPGVEDNENTSVPILLIDTAGCEFDELEVEEEDSKGNEGEADLVTLHAEKLINSGVRAVDIAIITPYNLQVDMIKSRLSHKYSSLEVKSVDGFQGREKEAVILSLVRSNKRGEVGFLSEDKRINVAITRAKRHLAVICDTETVSNHLFLKSFISHIESIGEVRFASEYEDMIQKIPKTNDSKQRTIKVLSNKNCESKDCQSKQKKREQKSRAWEQKHYSEKSSSIEDSSFALHEESRDKRIEEFRTILKEFWGNGKKSVYSFPPSLNSFERRIIHEIAEELGLIHESQGESSERYIIVKKIQNVLENVENTSISCQLKLGVHEIYCNPRKEVTQTEVKKIMTIGVNSPNDPIKGIGDPKEKMSDQKELLSDQTQFDLSERNECFLCKQIIPLKNIELHSIHCKQMSIAKEKKKKPTKSKSKSVVSEIPGDEFDALIENAIKANNVCSHDKCNKSTASIGQVCQFCRAQFCFSHHLPEIHGCGTAAKIQARSQIKKTGVLYPGSGKPEKISAHVRHSQLSKQLDKKISELSKQRKTKPKG